MALKTRLEPPAAVAGEQVRRSLTFRTLLRGGVEAVLGVNSRWLRTTRDLFVNAGRTAAEYVRGARDYSHPVAYALACVTAYVLAREFTTPSDSFISMFDPVIGLSAWWAYLSVPLLAPTALVLRLLFRRRQSSAAESYVLVLYVAAQIALMETVWTLVLHAGAPGVLGWAVRVLEGLYAMAAVVQFTGERQWHGWARAALVLGSALAAFGGAMWLYVWQVSSIFR